MRATVIGAGLAGCEAAWQLARRGVEVRLWEMKPARRSPAHHSDDFAELVCSNSLRSNRLENAVGLLKEELRRLGSLVITCADATQVEAGGALAVDRRKFSRKLSETIINHPNIRTECREADEIPEEGCVVVATGPLTEGSFARSVEKLLGGGFLHFYDAAAPIVTLESLDLSRTYAASRYGRGGEDYINCYMDEEEYQRFWEALCEAEQAQVHGFEDSRVFEGCMPVEVLARRGRNALVFGPMKPVGLTNPETGKMDHAVLQLRRDNALGTLYNLVGCQTHLKFSEQKRVFGMIPALRNAEFVRYGVMHRNTYIESPGRLDGNYRTLSDPRIYFAGQITGVEGYVESVASGLVAGWSLACELCGIPRPEFPKETAVGALGAYISDSTIRNFQPMNINFGIMTPLERRVKKRDKNLFISERALRTIEQYTGEHGEEGEKDEDHH